MTMKPDSFRIPLLAALALACLSFSPQAYADGSSGGGSGFGSGSGGPGIDLPASPARRTEAAARYKAVREQRAAELGLTADQRVKLDALDVNAKQEKRRLLALGAQAERDTILTPGQKKKLHERAQRLRGEIEKKNPPPPAPAAK